MKYWPQIVLHLLPHYQKLGYFIFNKTEKPVSHTRWDFENPGTPCSGQQPVVMGPSQAQTQPLWFLSYVFQSCLFHDEKSGKVKITFEQKCSLAPLLAGWLCPKWSDKVVRYNVAPTHTTVLETKM